MSTTLQIQTAKAFLPLLKPSRYKGAYGGRGSGKSHFFAELLIEESLYHKGLRSLCAREIQKSLKESAKRLLEDKLNKLGLGVADGFKVFREVIETPGGGIINFIGLQDHTSDSMKSYEGYGRFWCEEAQGLTVRSLDIVRPTMRADGSELWFSWNPRRKTDAIDMMLRGPNLPTDATVIRANWDANPWFPSVLEQERLDCLRQNTDQYGHIWEGDYATVLSGAYYAKHLADAKAQGRITNVAKDPLMTVRAFWDIGGTGKKADACAIWIGQFIGTQIRFLDYYEATSQELSVHVAWLRRNGYGDALCHLPHDGRQNDRVYDVSYESALRDAGFNVDLVPNQGQGADLQRIEAARRLFPHMHFDHKTQPGLDAIGWYHEKRDESRNLGLGVDHDWSSHGADAFGMAAVVYEMPKAAKTITRSVYQGAGGWMQ